MATFDFTGANGDPLPSGLTTVQGSFEIQDNEITSTASESSYAGLDFGVPDAIPTIYFTIGSSTTLGIVCRYGNFDDRLIFFVRNDGEVVGLSLSGGKFALLQEGYFLPNFDTSTEYKMDVDCQGSTIKVLVNDNLIYTITTSLHISRTNFGFFIGIGSGSVNSFSVTEHQVAQQGITITSVGDREVRQRDSNGDATFTIAGEISEPLGSSVVEYSTDGVTFNVLDPSPTSTSYSGDIVINGQKDVTVRLSETPEISATVEKVTAAKCIIAWWQSNEKGYGENLQAFSVNLGAPEPIILRQSGFSSPSDPTSFHDPSNRGSQWPIILSAYANEGTPVALANVAVGETLISRWLKSSNDLYTRIQDAYNSFGGVELVCCLGGETDTSENTNRATLIQSINSVVDDIKSDFGVDTFLTMYPTKNYGARVDDFFEDLTAVINTNPNARWGGNLQVIDLSSNTDKVHLKTDAQLAQAAQIRMDAFALNSQTVIDGNANQPPTANAGTNQSVAAGATVTLDGTGSTDGDGTIVSYAWTQPAGDTVTLTGATTATPSFTAPSTSAQQTLTFELTVTDDGGLTATDSVDVQVAAQVIESTLNAALTGIADGTYLTRVVDTDNDVLLFKDNKAWASGAASFTLPVAVGTNVEYYAYETTENGAGLQIGVTE